MHLRHQFKLDLFFEASHSLSVLARWLWAKFQHRFDDTDDDDTCHGNDNQARDLEERESSLANIQQYFKVIFETFSSFHHVSSFYPTNDLRLLAERSLNSIDEQMKKKLSIELPCLLLFEIIFEKFLLKVFNLPFEVLSLFYGRFNAIKTLNIYVSELHHTFKPARHRRLIFITDSLAATPTTSDSNWAISVRWRRNRIFDRFQNASFKWN